MGDLSNWRTIASIFTQSGILGYIFIEGLGVDVQAAIHGLVTIYHNLPPQLVTLEHSVSLLSLRNPLVREFEQGLWVCCLHGLYRDNVGLVCGHELNSDNSIIITVMP